MRCILLASVLFAVMLISSCGRERSAPSVTLPPTPVVVLRPTWAVVTDPYVRLRADPDPDAPIAGHLRRGDVSQIVAINTAVQRVDGERHYWYRLHGDEASGWALDRAVESYGSEYRARNAARQLFERE